MIPGCILEIAEWIAGGIIGRGINIVWKTAANIVPIFTYLKWVGARDIILWTILRCDFEAIVVLV